MRPGIWEVAIILLAVIVLFGARKLPELARALGASISEFKKAKKAAEADAEKPDDKSGPTC
jgi:sec-independent protein translocase protein TatA